MLSFSGEKFCLFTLAQNARLGVLGSLGNPFKLARGLTRLEGSHQLLRKKIHVLNLGHDLDVDLDVDVDVLLNLVVILTII
ncbi:hypothetical protein MegaChil _gp1021 [Megavirus chiliensis]|uniref:Uncharacterized protein mg1021 n=1 Tax=Megavirus chiliensis TaxID=1094892 RepID=G5CT58_9VIRU|nr:hypothetical protein MegaChil _gp1021 [Megavirus chiliensis]